jgi:hypothetical protein
LEQSKATTDFLRAEIQREHHQSGAKDDPTVHIVTISTFSRLGPQFKRTHSNHNPTSAGEEMFQTRWSEVRFHEFQSDERPDWFRQPARGGEKNG